MKAEEYEKLVEDSVKRRLDIARKKRADYATEDILSNFKRVGEAARTLQIPQLWIKEPALAYALFMVIMKADRLANLTVKGTPAQNEALEDTWDDMKNYSDLAEAIYLEPILYMKELREKAIAFGAPFQLLKEYPELLSFPKPIPKVKTKRKK